jgi:hypothetical protein
MLVDDHVEDAAGAAANVVWMRAVGFKARHAVELQVQERGGAMGTAVGIR